jgi:carbamoylphosphate synthase large subunit
MEFQVPSSQRIKVAISGHGGDVARGVEKCILSDFPNASFLRLGSNVNPQDSRDQNVAVRLPPVADDSYVEELLEALSSHNPDCYFPTIASELPYLNDGFVKSLSHLGIPAFINPIAITAFWNDKLKLFELLSSEQVPFARTTALSDDHVTQAHGPNLILKPRFGSGGRGVVQIPGSRLTNSYREVFENYIVQDDWSEDRSEFTLGVFVSSVTGITRSCMLMRTLQSGRSWWVRRVVNEGIESIAREVARRHSALYLNFQGFVGRSDYCFFEVNPRLSGSVYFQSPVLNAPSHWITEQVLGQKYTQKSVIGEFTGTRVITETFDFPEK